MYPAEGVGRWDLTRVPFMKLCASAYSYVCLEEGHLLLHTLFSVHQAVCSQCAFIHSHKNDLGVRGGPALPFLCSFFGTPIIQTWEILDSASKIPIVSLLFSIFFVSLFETFSQPFTFVNLQRYIVKEFGSHCTEVWIFVKINCIYFSSYIIWFITTSWKKVNTMWYCIEMLQLE